MRDGIGAEAEEAGMSEADLAGIAHEQMSGRARPARKSTPGPRGAGRTARARRRQNDGDEDGEEEKRAFRGPQGLGEHQTRSTLRRPNRPRGMTDKTTRIARKATASL